MKKESRINKLSKSRQENKFENFTSGNILINFLLGIRKYSGDLFGILLLVLALLSFLGVTGLTRGLLIDNWVELLVRGFGWGSYLLILFVLYVGVLVLFRRMEKFPRLNLSRLFDLELAIFSVIALLAISGSFSLERAENGLDGGVIGWGLATITNRYIKTPLDSILLILIALVTSMAGLGLSNEILKGIKNKSFNNKHPIPADSENMRDSVESNFPDTTPTDEHSRKIPVQEESMHKEKHDVELPPLSLLLPSVEVQTNKEYIQSQAKQIENTLAELHVPVKVIGYRVGPTVIQFAVEPGYYERINETGVLIRNLVKINQIKSLADDLKLALAVERLRIDAFPGYSYMGVEIPNQFCAKVKLQGILNSDEFSQVNSPLALALGLDVANQPVTADLIHMPHLLIGGTTGSGKSVCIINLIVCLLMKNSPSSLRLILLDPKRVELVRFQGIPHLLGSVESEPRIMVSALQWAVMEMQRRLLILQEFGARDLDSYNEKMIKRGMDSLPRIVVFIDELADMMSSAPEPTDEAIRRLSQMARATGIHMVVSTQRPSADIVSGVIKSNFPARIAFNTASPTDSRVILDSTGAEDLLGNGDLLFLNPEMSGLTRAQSPYIEKIEIENVINYWKQKVPTPHQVAPWEITSQASNVGESEQIDMDGNLLKQAIRVVQKEGKASASLLQRRLNIGFPKAAHLIDELEAKGYIGPAESGGREREVFYPPEDES
jgi:S-DNA-T family DNA segregation ATPase FtsK/SpoIIIE